MTVSYLYRDCGCRAKWSGDDLIVVPCEVHAQEWKDEDFRPGYAGPATLIEPGHRFPEVHHGDN